MKNKEIVKILIDKLKKQATSDFELHRVEVLERDFFNPPKPEQVDETHQKFDGRKFTLKPGGHYVSYFPIHQAVYNYYCGEIPDGYIIHHIDENKADNDISNLECLTPTEHRRIHNFISPVRHAICKNCGKIFLYRNAGTSSNFCSDKCRGTYKARVKTSAVYETRTCEICGKEFRTRKRDSATTCSKKCAVAKKNKNYIPPKITAVCKVCGREFLTNKSKPSSCCSTHCRSLLSYHNQFETRICEVCGKEFSCYKHAETRFCSHICANKKRFENHVPVSKMTTRTCVICGKEFTCNKFKNTRACSPECGRKLAWQTRRKKSIK